MRTRGCQSEKTIPHILRFGGTSCSTCDEMIGACNLSALGLAGDDGETFSDISKRSECSKGTVCSPRTKGTWQKQVFPASLAVVQNRG